MGPGPSPAEIPTKVARSLHAPPESPASYAQARSRFPWGAMRDAQISAGS